MEHYVKIEKQYADAIIAGDKNFEIRFNDRGYQKGDTLRFNVLKRSHPLDDRRYRITYVHSGLGMADGYVALAIEPCINEYAIPDEIREELEKQFKR